MPTTDNQSGPRYSSSPLRPYHYWMPRFWHGMQLGTWLRLLARNRCAVTPSRIPMAAGITLTAALNSCSSVFDRLVLDYARSHTKLAQPPLFVLGHWRSGTTMLHELLILDPEHTYPTTFECYVPHHFAWTEWWLPPLIEWLLPATRPMDNMRTSWDRPQEDEFALCNMGVPSPYLALGVSEERPGRRRVPRSAIAHRGRARAVEGYLAAVRATGRRRPQPPRRAQVAHPHGSRAHAAGSGARREVCPHRARSAVAVPLDGAAVAVAQ